MNFYEDNFEGAEPTIDQMQFFVYVSELLTRIRDYSNRGPAGRVMAITAIEEMYELANNVDIIGGDVDATREYFFRLIADNSSL